MKNDENPEDSRNEIPEMKLDNKYSDKKPGISEMSEMQKEMEKTKKEMEKIKKEVVSETEKIKQKIWVHVKTPIDVFEICLDSKFEMASAIAMSFPLFDKGFLGALRVAEIHKSLVLQKFERYVVSYV